MQFGLELQLYFYPTYFLSLIINENKFSQTST